MAGVIKSLACAAATLAAFACATPEPTPQGGFWQDLQALCGQSYAGRLASADAADAAFASSPLVMLVRECSTDEVRIPFHVGDDRSRTWVITRTEQGLRLKHDHRHEDGGEDRLSQYGGDTTSEGSATRQEFPADAFSRALFVENGIPQSAANVWALELAAGRLFAYELRRPNRHFRVEFDLTQPLASPPAR
jgi:hypothetical protein